MPDFRINVVIDPRQAQPGARRVEGSLQRVQDRADGLRKTLTRTLTLLGGGALIFRSIRTLAQFEQTMSTVKAVTGATADEFQLLSNRAKELGISTRFTATQAAEGLVELARAGLSVSDSLEAVGSSLLLAQAGALGLAEAADITTTAIKVFGLEASQATDVADVLVIAANSAKTNVSEMGQAFTFAAANANDLELSVEETTAALAVLAEGGLRATRGGTALRAVLLALAAPTEEAKAAFASAQVSLEDVDIQARGIIPVLQTLAAAQLDVGEKTAIFGKRFGAAASILLRNIPKFEEVIGKFETMSGEAQRVADVMDDNLNGALLRTKSAFEGLILEIGAAGAGGGLQGILEGVAKGLRFLATNVEVVIRAFEFLIIVLGTRFALRTVPRVIAAVGRLAASIQAAFLLNPIGLFVTAIGLATAALVTFGRDMKIVEGEATTFGDVLEASGETAQMAFQGLLDFLRSTFSGVFDALGISADVGIKDMLNVVAFGLDAVAGLFRATFNVIKVAFDLGAVAEALLSGVFEAINGFIRGTEQAFDELRATVSGILKTIGDAASATVDLLGAVAQASLAKVNPFQEKETADILFERVATLRKAIDLSGDAFGRNINHALRELRAEDTFDELYNPFEGAGEDLGKRMADAWTEGFKTQAESGAQSVLEGVFKRADAIAAQREKAAQDRLREQEAKAAAEAAAAAAGATGGGPGQDTAQETADAERRNTTLDQYRQGIRDEIALLGLASQEREIAAELLQLENELREEGLDLTAAQKDAVEAELQLLQARQLQAEILDEIRGPQEDLLAQQTAINQLFDDGRITIEEYNKALADLAESDSITSLQDQLVFFAEFAEQTLGTVFQGLEDGLVELATTGEVNFSRLVDGMIQDLARLLVQQGLKIFLNALSGGTGGTIGAVISAAGGGLEGRAAGGPTTADTPFVVGEQGPEIFVPEQAGRVLSTQESMRAVGGTAAAAPAVVPAPEVNVSVVNVQDPSEVVDAIGSSEGERAIVNIMRRRRREVRNALG